MDVWWRLLLLPPPLSLSLCASGNGPRKGACLTFFAYTYSVFPPAHKRKKEEGTALELMACRVHTRQSTYYTTLDSTTIQYMRKLRGKRRRPEKRNKNRVCSLHTYGKYRRYNMYRQCEVHILPYDPGSLYKTFMDQYSVYQSLI